MAQEEKEEGVQAPPPRKRGRLLLIVGVVLLLGLGGGAVPHDPLDLVHLGAVDEHPKKPDNKPEIFLALDPAFVVNFRDDQSVRYLQVGVSLMSHDAAAIEAAKESQPVIRNALVMLFSGQSYAGLIDAAGKQKLQAQALAAVQKIISDRTGKPGIDALYFTSFVMQ